MDKFTSVGNTPPEFHMQWQEWLADKLIRGSDPQKITAVMLRNGFPEQLVAQKIEDITLSPAFRAGQEIFQSKRKLLNVFKALSTQYRQSNYAKTFPKIESLSPAEFYTRYYYGNRPVVIRGLMADWQALRLWTPDYFAREFGECKVEISSGRSTDPRYEENFDKHRTTILMKDYIAMINEGGETNDYYLAARNSLLEQEAFKVLFQHFKCPEGFLDPKSLRGRVKFWLGPKGTITPLHHDARNVLLGQIYGRKRVQIIAPYDIEHVYNERGDYSNVDLDNIDYDKFPLMRDVSIIDVDLQPGEFILLPLGWWHWVKSLDISISLSFTNFCVDNPILWDD